MNCLKCYALIDDNARVCPYCGSDVKKTQEEFASSLPKEKPRPKGQPLLGLAIFGALLITLSEAMLQTDLFDGKNGFYVMIISFSIALLGIVFSVCALAEGISKNLKRGPLSLGTIVTSSIALLNGLITALWYILIIISWYLSGDIW